MSFKKNSSGKLRSFLIIIRNKSNKYTVKPVFSGHSKKRPKISFHDPLSLKEGRSITEFSLGAFCNTFDLH